MSDRRSLLMVKAFKRVLDKRVSEAVENANKQPRPISVEAPHVTNEVRTPEVHVDMVPVANAIDKMTDALQEQSTLMAQLLQVLADQPIEFKPVINAADNSVDVQAIAKAVAEAVIAVLLTRQPPRRRVSVEHSDGTRSTITQE